MAAGMTDHVWTTAEWLSYRVPAEFIDQLSTIEQVFPDLGGAITPVEGHYPILLPRLFLSDQYIQPSGLTYRMWFRIK
jgi:hypothetical protein